jgi:endonuclease YncB( thermonuclease family)
VNGYRSWERRSRATQVIIALTLLAGTTYFLWPSGAPLFAGGKREALGSQDNIQSQTRLFVTRVVDGDTVRLSDGRRVRLAQIDAPEVGERECHGLKSSQVLARIAVPGRTTVRLETDPVVGRKDAFGRSLGYLVAGSRNVNLALVRAGAASVWFFDGQRGRYAAELMQAAREARSTHAGLWAACPRTALDPTQAVMTGGS